MNNFLSLRVLKKLLACICFSTCLLLLAGCSSLLPKPPPQPTFYTLEAAQPIAAAPATPAIAGAPSISVSPPRAAAGFDSQRIIYVRTGFQLEYFANSEWVDTPARMLAPLIVSALSAASYNNSAAFSAVLPSPSTATADIRLDNEILRLQHDFSGVPSQVRFSLRAYLIDSSTRRVLAWRDFDASVAATSDNPYGGVVAANRAVQQVLQELARFSAAAAASWPRKPAEPR